MNYTKSIDSKYLNILIFFLHLSKADFISCIVPVTNLFMSPLISGFITEHRNTWALSMLFPQPELHGFGFPLFDGSGFVILLISKMSFRSCTVNWLLGYRYNIFPFLPPSLFSLSADNAASSLFRFDNFLNIDLLVFLISSILRPIFKYWTVLETSENQSPLTGWCWVKIE